MMTNYLEAKSEKWQLDKLDLNMTPKIYVNNTLFLDAWKIGSK